MKRDDVIQFSPFTEKLCTKSVLILVTTDGIILPKKNITLQWGGNSMSEKETYESMSFQQLYKVLQESYTELASKPETVPISPEEFESCLNTLNKLCSLRSPTASAYEQAPKISPKELTRAALSSVARESIKGKLDWIDERFSVATENFSNETEIGLTLLQSCRMLREQIWPLCAASPYHRRLLTFLINALYRAKPKSITKSHLNLLKENIALLATTEITIETLEEAENALLTIE